MKGVKVSLGGKKAQWTINLSDGQITLHVSSFLFTLRWSIHSVFTLHLALQPLVTNFVCCLLVENSYQILLCWRKAVCWGQTTYVRAVRLNQKGKVRVQELRKLCRTDWTRDLDIHSSTPTDSLLVLTDRLVEIPFLWAMTSLLWSLMLQRSLPRLTHEPDMLSGSLGHSVDDWKQHMASSERTTYQTERHFASWPSL